MRDLLVTLTVVGVLPVILFRPWVGILAWSWLAYMNPHRLTWGFAYSMPFSQLVALATLAGLLVTKERRGVPINAVTIVWFSLVVWWNVTTVFAIYPDDAVPEWDRAMKIQLFSFLTVMLIAKAERIEALIWTIVVSLLFFGVKGGIFAVLTGGSYRVFGPAETFFEDNNAMGLVLIMALPLAYYLVQSVKAKHMRYLMLGCMALTGLAILSTHSRGALLASSAMIFMLWMKSEHKLWTGLGILCLVPIGILFMPEHWFERMGTITEYQQDSSAMGRINAWWFAFNLALDRPLVGGGFNVFDPELFLRYAPNPTDFHDSHSIYFEMLGEHGFVGLGLFLLLGWLTYRMGTRIAKRCHGVDDLQWASRLARAFQMSLVGYAVGGAFLGLAYFDLLYHYVAIMVILDRYVREAVSELAPSKHPARLDRIPGRHRRLPATVQGRAQ